MFLNSLSKACKKGQKYRVRQCLYLEELVLLCECSPHPALPNPNRCQKYTKSGSFSSPLSPNTQPFFAQIKYVIKSPKTLTLSYS